jgi:hypothetical protein
MPGLSLEAELLLLSIAPAHGGLLPTHGRRRLRRALAAARLAEVGTKRPGWLVGRAARRELIDAGLVERALLLRNLRLVDIAGPGQRFRRLVECVETGVYNERREGDLIVLLAAAGVLAERLTTHQRWTAAKRLRSLIPPSEAGVWQAPLGGQIGISQGLGSFAAAGMMSDAFGLVGGADGGGFDGGGFDGGGPGQ